MFGAPPNTPGMMAHHPGVKEHEWMQVGSWVYDHFDEVSGISFLPFSEHTYQQAPYQDIDEKEYKEFLTKNIAKFGISKATTINIKHM